MRSLWVVAFVAALSAHAYADDGHTLADKLFEEAQALKQAGKMTEACAKYEEALAANKNAVGTVLNVAKCHEDAGKIATAVKLYEQARDLARENKLDEHRAAAEKRLGEIQSRVPHLAIAYTERIDGMKLVIDDVVYPTDANATALPLDPGSRHVVVTAPSRLPYSTDVVLVEGKDQSVTIPRLGKAVTVNKARRTVGKILTFSGAGLGLTGLVLGYLANDKYEDQFRGVVPNCMGGMNGGPPLCNAAGNGETKTALFMGNVGTVVGITGAVALGVGVFLWLTAPAEPSEERQLAVVPAVTNESAGIAAVGRF